MLACLFATWLIWGSTYFAIRLALPGLPPFVQSGTRFVVAGCGLLAWMRLVRGAAFPTLREWRNAALVGTLMLAGGVGATAFAEQSVGSGLVVVFVAVVPILVALGNLYWRVLPSRLEAAGILTGLAGVVLLTRGAGFSASPLGLLAQSIAVLCWSSGSLLSQHGFAAARGATGFASQMLCGGIALLALAGVSGEWDVAAAHWPPSPTVMVAWLYLVVFGSLIAFNAYMILLARAPAALATSYCFVNPVIALMLGVWVGGEVVTGAEWLASGVVLSGVVLVLAARALAAPTKARR